MRSSRSNCEVHFQICFESHRESFISHFSDRDRAADAASAIAKLAEDSETTCIAVGATAGLFENLVLLLVEGTADGKVNAAWALAQLALGSENNASAIASIPTVFDALSDGLLHGSSKQKEMSALALGSLAVELEHRSAIGQIPGVLAALASLVNEGTTNAKANAALALGNLCIDCVSNSREFGKSPGLFDALVKLMDSATDECREVEAFFFVFRSSI